MGNRSVKSKFRNAIIHLNISAELVSVHDDKFWAQIWTEDGASAAEIIKAVSTQEIRMLRDGSPQNFATLAYMMAERLHLARQSICNTSSQQTALLTAIRILTRLIPCTFEDDQWRWFFADNRLQDLGQSKREPELSYPHKSQSERDYSSYVPLNCRPRPTSADTASKASTTRPAGQSGDEGAKLVCTTDDDGSSDCSDKHQGRETSALDQFGHIILASSSTPGPETGTIRPEGAPERANVTGSLMELIVLSICDLLFCPELTVLARADSYLASSVDGPPEDLSALLSCEYVWEPGVGFESSANSTTQFDKNRSELLRLLLTSFSLALYQSPQETSAYNYTKADNPWIEIFSSTRNRHVLPLFTSLLNTTMGYNPCSFLPFNHLLFTDNREELVELCLHVLIATLDHDDTKLSPSALCGSKNRLLVEEDEPVVEVKPVKTKSELECLLFANYASRIHRPEDLVFIIKGFTRLLNNRLEQGILASSNKHINFDEELLILLWKLCNLNKAFVNHLLKTNDIIDIVLPILYHLNENICDPSKTALIHIGVFNLLILSGERNFGVRLNKVYPGHALISLPAFTGSHADLMIIIFHKLILHCENLEQLYDYLLTIVVNVSPYLKALSMVTSKCLTQLFEIFSSPYVIFTQPSYHQLVVFLLDIFNNLVQYQFDGNAKLVCAILEKRHLFLNLANLPTSQQGIDKVLNKLFKRRRRQLESERHQQQLEGATDEETTGQWSPNSLNNQSEKTYSSSSSRQRSSAATLSSERPGSGLPGLRHGEAVSLVATPDIDSVTQQMRLSSLEATQTPPSGELRTSCIDNDCLDSPKSWLKFEQYPNKTNVGGLMVSQQWQPTAEWARKWRPSLPLQTSIRMIEVLAPQLDRLGGNEPGSPIDETEVIKFIQNGTLVGLLPVPHPILIRKYQTNSATGIWFRACTWGSIYVRNNIWAGTNIKLIKIV